MVLVQCVNNFVRSTCLLISPRMFNCTITKSSSLLHILVKSSGLMYSQVSVLGSIPMSEESVIGCDNESYQVLD